MSKDFLRAIILFETVIIAMIIASTLAKLDDKALCELLKGYKSFLGQNYGSCK